MQILKSVLIDLSEFNLKLVFKGSNKKPLLINFDNPNRRFFCALISLIVIKMKNRKNFGYIDITKQRKTLEVIDEGLLGENASKSHTLRLDKCRRAWRGRLLELERAKLFKILNRDPIKYPGPGKEKYLCGEKEIDLWPALFGYNKAIGRSWHWKFAVDEAGIGLDDIQMLYKDKEDGKAWENFIGDLLDQTKNQGVEPLGEKLIEEIEIYLHEFIEKLKFDFRSTNTFVYNYDTDLGDALFQDLYIPINVTTKIEYRSHPEFISDYAETEGELFRAYSFKGCELQNINFEPWDDVKVRFQKKNLTILADPGFGKTTLLRKESLNFAEEQIKRLKNGGIVNDIDIPIFIKLYDLGNSNSEIIDSVTALIKRDYQKSWEYIKNLIREKLESGKCALFLDALDEVPMDLREELKNKINRFYRDFKCRIICTSRLVGYRGSFLYDSKELEIIQFSRKQIKDYINIWFKLFGLNNKISYSAEKLIRELNLKPQVYGLAQNPLLLSYICPLSQEKNFILPLRRCLLYDNIVNFMLGKWSQSKKIQTDLTIAAKKIFLKEIAYRLSCKNSHVFDIEDLLVITSDILIKHKSLSEYSSAVSLLTEVSDYDGMLIPIDREDKRYIFLHRTFQEFFTASYLYSYFKNDTNSGIDLVKEYYWDYEWHATLSLLAGLLDDPTPLLLSIFQKKDDIFHSLLVLLSRCISECIEENGSIFRHTIEKIYNHFKKENSGYLSPILINIAQVNSQMFELIIREIVEKYNIDKKNIAINALGRIGGHRTTDLLIRTIKDKNCDVSVRNTAINAIVKIEDPEAAVVLIEVIKDENSSVRLCAAKALGEIHCPAASAAIIEALKDDDENVRTKAVTALGRMCYSGAVKALVEVLKNKKNNINFRINAAEALGKIGTLKSANLLIEAIKHEQSDFKSLILCYYGILGGPKAAKSLIIAIHSKYNHDDEALSYLGDSNAIQLLVEHLKEMSFSIVTLATVALRKAPYPEASRDLVNVLMNKKNPAKDRKAAANALGIIGDSKATAGLIDALKDNGGAIRSAAAIALANIADPNTTNVLLGLVNDADRKVKHHAIKALGKIGATEAIEILIEILQNKTSRSRADAAQALGEIGDYGSATVLIDTLKENHLLMNYDSVLVSYQSAQALNKIGNLETLEILIKSPKIDYKSCGTTFSLMRDLMIRYSKEHRNKNVPFIPVYPEIIRKYRRCNLEEP